MHAQMIHKPFVITMKIHKYFPYFFIECNWNCEWHLMWKQTNLTVMDYIFDAAVIWVDEVLKYSITFCNIYQLANSEKRNFLERKICCCFRLFTYRWFGIGLHSIESFRYEKKGEGLPIDWHTQFTQECILFSDRQRFLFIILLQQQYVSHRYDFYVC